MSIEHKYTWKTDPDMGLLEISVNGELLAEWCYEDDLEPYVEDFKRIYEAGFNAQNALLAKELEAVKAENERFKDWIWHKKYSEASSQGASHEIAKDFADNGIDSLINKEG